MNRSFWAAIKVGKAAKYKWPLIPDVDLGSGMTLIQTSQEVFAITGLTEGQAKGRERMLLSALKKYAPIRTGRLRRSYNVYPLKGKSGKWGLVIYNTAWYFRFAYHYYRGEIRFNKTFIKDFVEKAVRETVRRIK